MKRAAGSRLGRIFSAWLLLAVLTACASYQPEPQSLIGRWRAESVSLLQGVRLPLGPEVVFTSDAMLVAGETFAFSSLEQRKSEVTVNLKSGIGLVLVFESRDRMYFTVPLVGSRIYYNRVT